MTIPTLKEVPAGWPTHISQNKKRHSQLSRVQRYIFFIIYSYNCLGILKFEENCVEVRSKDGK